jgi:hypothetical protein
MKTVAALILVALSLAVPSSAGAATIAFEQPFSLSKNYEFEAFPGSAGILDRHYFDVSTGWAVPVFDPALGTVEALFLELNGLFSINGELEPDVEALVVTLFIDPRTLFPVAFGSPQPCGRPCFTNILVDEEWQFTYLQSNPPFHFPIGTHFDSHLFYDVSAAGSFHVEFTGVARATYLYEPQVMPEPTSLLLVGSGAAALLTRAHRRKRSLLGG